MNRAGRASRQDSRPLLAPQDHVVASSSRRGRAGGRETSPVSSTHFRQARPGSGWQTSCESCEDSPSLGVRGGRQARGQLCLPQVARGRSPGRAPGVSLEPLQAREKKEEGEQSRGRTGALGGRTGPESPTWCAPDHGDVPGAQRAQEGAHTNLALGARAPPLHLLKGGPAQVGRPWGLCWA